MFSFDSAFSDDGLFVNVISFLGFGKVSLLYNLPRRQLNTKKGVFFVRNT